MTDHAVRGLRSRTAQPTDGPPSLIRRRRRDDQGHKRSAGLYHAGLVAAWGIAHAIPARKVLAGFELIALAILTALTGTRTPAVWFKIRPALLAAAAALLLITRFL